MNNNLLKGRIITAHLSKYIAEVDNQKYSLEVSGRFKYMAMNKSDYPVVGDYVNFRPTNENEGIIERVEERFSSIKRLAVSNIHNAQIVASNIDLVFVCMSLNSDFNIKKLQNFMSMTYSDDYETIILLTKSDLGRHIDKKVNEIKSIKNHEVVVVSAYNEEDIENLRDIISTKTCVFVGSSGVGKSTLVNRLLGYEYLETNTIRVSDSQGRHTTVHRELVHLPNGGSVIDTPGIRLPNSYSVDNMETHFDDIFELAQGCKFRDCSHTNETDCNVQEALEDGRLSLYRFEQYLKAERLNRFVILREKQKERIQEKRMHKRK